MRNARNCNRFCETRKVFRGRLHAVLTRLQSEIPNPKSQIVLLLICTVAFALRLGPLFDNRFHPDEALFSTWALKIARGENLLLIGVPIDKPPLLIYLNALSFFVFGQSELAARVPNLIASVISVPLVYQLAKSLIPGVKHPHSERSAAQPKTAHVNASPVLAALLLALSPLAILFAPTAFLDPTMVMFGLASLVAASRGRAGWAGILLGLSFATKVQGLLFLPLVALFWSRQEDKEISFSVSHALRRPIRFAVGFSAIAACVLIWDRARGGLPFWVQQTINYGDLRVIYAAELAPRFSGWLNFLPYFFGPIVELLGLIGLPILLYRDFAQRTCTRVTSHALWIDLGLLAYTIGFLALHWLFDFPVWDRYLLILVPIVALLFARSLPVLLSSCLLVFKSHRDASQSARLSLSPSLLRSIIALVMLPFSLAAAESQYPLGGDHGANDGIEQVAVYLKGLPSGTVVYEHELAWLLGYYMGDGFAYLSYYDTPADLTDDLRVFGRHDDRYVILPGRASLAEVIDAIGQVGYTVTPVFATQDRFGQTSFTIYQIVKRTA
jgi:4-amino-4-deoxy-L-arabinose transferase-like glycosyltransferase